MVIDAHIQREKQADIDLKHHAWLSAALGRTRVLPKLETLLNPPESKEITPDELEEHRNDFERMKSAWQKRHH